MCDVFTVIMSFSIFSSSASQIEGLTGFLLFELSGFFLMSTTGSASSSSSLVGFCGRRVDCLREGKIRSESVVDEMDDVVLEPTDGASVEEAVARVPGGDVELSTVGTADEGSDVLGTLFVVNGRSVEEDGSAVVLLDPARSNTRKV